MYTFRINLRTHVEEPLADHGIQEHSVCAWSGGRSVELTSKERIQQRTIEDMEGVSTVQMQEQTIEVVNWAVQEPASGSIVEQNEHLLEADPVGASNEQVEGHIAQESDDDQRTLSKSWNTFHRSSRKISRWSNSWECQVHKFSKNSC